MFSPLNRPAVIGLGSSLAPIHVMNSLVEREPISTKLLGVRPTHDYRVPPCRLQGRLNLRIEEPTVVIARVNRAILRINQQQVNVKFVGLGSYRNRLPCSPF